jgi:hypothetical protein
MVSAIRRPATDDGCGEKRGVEASAALVHGAAGALGQLFK